MKKLLKNRKGIGWIASSVIIAIAIIVVVVVVGWFVTHYDIPAGYVGVVTDQVGGIVRIEAGPRWQVGKGLMESVKTYSIQVQTVDMISKANMVNGTREMLPDPLEGLEYGAVGASAKNCPNVFIDVTFQWHIVGTLPGEDIQLVKYLYLNYPGEDYKDKTLVPVIRDSVYDFANEFTIDELMSNREIFSDPITEYCRKELAKIETLGGAIVIDKVSIRQVTPPKPVQEAYMVREAAYKEAEATMTRANATRDAAIQVAIGQSQAIELVVNATSESIKRLVQQNVTADKAVEYMGLQYIYDSLKKIAAENPDWKITIFINSPEVQYTIPVEP